MNKKKAIERNKKARQSQSICTLKAQKKIRLMAPSKRATIAIVLYPSR
jgi:hypothetical protein